MEDEQNDKMTKCSSFAENIRKKCSSFINFHVDPPVTVSMVGVTVHPTSAAICVLAGDEAVPRVAVQLHAASQKAYLMTNWQSIA